MRSLRCPPRVPTALVLTILPIAPLMAQQDDAMKGTKEVHAGMAMKESSAEGPFTGVNGHRVSGTAHLVSSEGKRRLHFTPDFSLEKAPDVYVTLTNGPKPEKDASVVVAKLTHLAGEQTFDLPADTDPGRYSHVVLWCKKYSVALAQAALHAAGRGKMEQDGGKQPPSKPN